MADRRQGLHYGNHQRALGYGVVYGSHFTLARKEGKLSYDLELSFYNLGLSIVATTEHPPPQLTQGDRPPPHPAAL